jgi:hypothetical protein
VRVFAGALLLLLPAIGFADEGSPDAALIEQGRRLYMEGVRSDGQPLVAGRLGNAELSGAAAACVACHKRSGLGGVEGDVIVPPITGPALYAGERLRDRVVLSMDPRRGRAWNPSHPPYGDATLMAAIRDGVHVTGRPMNPLMPRYAIAPAELAALKAYLGTVSAQWSPGATEHSVRFATVIAPGVEPARREAYLATLRALFDQKNSNTLPGRRHMMINAAEMMLHIERTWDLDVWELQGPPQTWEAQLDRHYRTAPVFALVSGLGDGTWEPVQAFAERSGVPCWFPSIASVPAGADRQFYSLYFSNGVALEAQALAGYLGGLDHRLQPQRVVQLLRDEPAARSAAAAFERASAGAGWSAQRRVLEGAGPGALQDALRAIDAGTALVLWLRPDDLRALADAAPPAAAVYVSTLLGGGEHAPIAAPWRARAKLAYPYELPDRRAPNLATFHSWIRMRNLPLVDEAMQSEVFFSVGYLMYTMSEMLDNVYRDYLVERGENMLRRRELGRAEEETLVRMGGHPPAPKVAAASTRSAGAVFDPDPHGGRGQMDIPAVGVRQGTTIYPRLDLAPGQRFASKGAYIVHFAQAEGEALVADSDWIVP